MSELTGLILLPPIFRPSIIDLFPNCLTNTQKKQKINAENQYGWDMKDKERLKTLKAEEYQGIFGVKKRTFDAMLEVLKKKRADEHKKGGRPPRMSEVEKLCCALSYWREYRTMRNIAYDRGVAASLVCDAVKWVEDTLIKSGLFSLPKKQSLCGNDVEVEVALVDVTECEIERPKKNSAGSIRGRKSGIR